jgi:hypothetical protein
MRAPLVFLMTPSSSAPSKGNIDASAAIISCLHLKEK